jgi:T-complex protein 1 subunit gamma
MIQLSRTQDEEVGDGTTSVIILAGELLQVGRCLADTIKWKQLSAMHVQGCVCSSSSCHIQ